MELPSQPTNRRRPFSVTLLYTILQDERYNPPPAVLPRRGVIVIALGSFKALVHTEACLLFEAGKMDVSHIAPVLAELMRVNAQVRV